MADVKTGVVAAPKQKATFEEIQNLVKKERLEILGIVEEVITSDADPETRVEGERENELHLTVTVANELNVTALGGRTSRGTSIPLRAKGTEVHVAGKEDVEAFRGNIYKEVGEDGKERYFYNGTMMLDVSDARVRLDRTTGRQVISQQPRIWLRTVPFYRSRTNLLREQAQQRESLVKGMMSELFGEAPAPAAAPTATVKLTVEEKK